LRSSQITTFIIIIVNTISSSIIIIAHHHRSSSPKTTQRHQEASKGLGQKKAIDHFTNYLFDWWSEEDGGVHAPKITLLGTMFDFAPQNLTPFKKEKSVGYLIFFPPWHFHSGCKRAETVVLLPGTTRRHVQLDPQRFPAPAWGAGCGYIDVLRVRVPWLAGFFSWARVKLSKQVGDNLSSLPSSLYYHHHHHHLNAHTTQLQRRARALGGSRGAARQ